MQWRLELNAQSAEEPSRLMRRLSAAVLKLGGWVLDRGREEGRMRLKFEFEQRACEEVYAAVIAAGVELSQEAHRRLTELCQCTRMLPGAACGAIVGVELEVRPVAEERIAGRFAAKRQPA